MMKKRGRGRPPGTPQTRNAIREAARIRFGRHGYRAVTLREIAHDAGVDPALIHYYFGSKRELLAEVLALRANPATLLRERLALPLEQFPRAVLTALLDIWESPQDRPSLLALVVSIGQDSAADPVVREYLQLEIASPLARRLEQEGVHPDAARIRAGAFISQVLGLVFARYVLAVGPIAEARPDDVVDAIAPVLGSLLRGDS